MNKEIMIGNHKISEDSPTFVIAEMSANHLMDFDRAVAIMQAAKDAGMNDHVAKPIDMNVLLPVIAKYIR